MPRYATRLDRLPPYVFVTISENVQKLTAAGHNVLRLDIGSPDMPPPPHVVEALAKAAADPTRHGYSGYRGVPAFRQAVAAYYQRRFGITLDPEHEVLPLLGSKEGIVNLILAHADHNMGVMVPEINYPAYGMGTLLSGGEVIEVPMPVESNYLIDFENIAQEDAARSSVLWINYPNNPTGAVASTQFYQQAVDFCTAYDLLLASDNPYVEVAYDGYVAGSVLQAEDAKNCAVEFISFSKSYNMAGWRLGAAVGNREALARLLNIKSNMDSGHFKAIYDAGIAALEDTPQSWIDERNAIYQQRRDKLLAALPDVGLQAQSPKGAMYIWAKVTERDPQQYVEDALQQAHVSIAPGAAYGSAGAGYVRLSVGVADERLDEAIDRLKRWYARG